MVADAGEKPSLLFFLLCGLLGTLWVAPPEIYPGAAFLAALLLPALGGTLLWTGWLPDRGQRWFLAALVLPLAISHHFALDNGGSLHSMIRLAGALILFAAARRVSPAEARGLLMLLAGGMAVLSLHGLWQYLVGFDRLLADRGLPAGVVERLQTYRVFGRSVLPSVFASLLFLALPVSVGLASAARGLARLAWGMAALLSGVAVLLTRSHGALLAAALAAILWGAAGRGISRRWMLCGAAILVAGFFLVVQAREGVILSPANAQGPLALRGRNLIAATRMILQHPIAGVGGDGFGSAYPAYRRSGDNETRFAHNTYLQAVAEHGLPMLLPVALGLVMLLGAIRRVGTRGAPPAVGAAFGLSVFLLHNAWDISASLESTVWTAAVLAGVIAAEGDRLAPPVSWRTDRWAWPAWGRLVLCTAALAVFCAGGFLAGRMALARVAQDRSRQALSAGAWRRGYTQAVRAESLCPWEAGYPLLQAETLLHHPEVLSRPERAPQQALAAASRVVLRNRAWPAARHVRALALHAVGRTSDAAAELGQAAALYPARSFYRDELERLGQAVGARSREAR
ncbi:MAG: O-antigen ligase family protein [Acidobacteriota bacterium]